MKRKTILLLICVLCFNIADAQRKRDEKDPLIISMFNSFNFRQGMPNYTYQDFSEYLEVVKALTLTFYVFVLINL